MSDCFYLKLTTIHRMYSYVLVFEFYHSLNRPVIVVNVHHTYLKIKDGRHFASFI